MDPVAAWQLHLATDAGVADATADRAVTEVAFSDDIVAFVLVALETTSI